VSEFTEEDWEIIVEKYGDAELTVPAFFQLSTNYATNGSNFFVAKNFRPKNRYVKSVWKQYKIFCQGY
jgi:hypothetical protein